LLVDLSISVTKIKSQEAFNKQNSVSFGHLGTHLDTMNKEFPLHFVKREGIVFNVKGLINEEIDLKHIDLSLVKPDMFIAFYSGFPQFISYGSKGYFSNHPQLSDNLIDALLEKRISLIGIDFAGVRRGSEHTPKDQYCADRGVFIVENLCNLDKIVMNNKSTTCLMNTYPVRFEGLSGLPCRVIAEI
jgi:kynurenine formamidase